MENEHVESQLEVVDINKVRELMESALKDMSRISKCLRLQLLLVPHDLKKNNLGVAAYQLTSAIVSGHKMEMSGDFNDPFTGELFQILIMNLPVGDDLLEHVTVQGDAVFLSHNLA